MPTIVTIDSDPRSLNADATESDVEQFRVRVEDLLNRDLPGKDIQVRAAPCIGFECSDSAVAARMVILETTDEWIGLLND